MLLGARIELAQLPQVPVVRFPHSAPKAEVYTGTILVTITLINI